MSPISPSAHVSSPSHCATLTVLAPIIRSVEMPRHFADLKKPFLAMKMFMNEDGISHHSHLEDLRTELRIYLVIATALLPTGAHNSCVVVSTHSLEDSAPTSTLFSI